MPSKTEYFPVDRISMSGDDTAQSLFSHDQRGERFERRRPAHKHRNLALKAVLLLSVLVLHTGLVVLLAKWLASSAVGSQSSSNSQSGRTGGHGHGHGEDTCETEDTHRQYGFEGVIPAVYKDPKAEFLMVNPCGHTAAEARAKGCRYGMLYGAWLPEACYDEETEENFRKYADWRFWLQPNRTQELSYDEVATGEYDYVLVEWQCKYLSPLCPNAPR
jgi:hypothetical protein